MAMSRNELTKKLTHAMNHGFIPQETYCSIMADLTEKPDNRFDQEWLIIILERLGFGSRPVQEPRL